MVMVLILRHNYFVLFCLCIVFLVNSLCLLVCPWLVGGNEYEVNGHHLYS